MESAGNPSNAECGGPTWRLVAKTHNGRNNDGKRQAQESSNFDHGLQDERGSGTVQMRNREWGAYSALIPALRAATVSPRSPESCSPECFRGSGQEKVLRTATPGLMSARNDEQGKRVRKRP